MTAMSKRGLKRAPLSEGRRRKYTVAFDPQHWKELEQHCRMTGATLPQVIEAAVLSHIGGDDLDRRMDIINRSLMQIQRRLGRIELHGEITAQTLGDFIIYWMMVNPPLPDDQRGVAYKQAEIRFDKFVAWMAERLQKGRVWYETLADDKIATPPPGSAPEAAELEGQA